MRLNANGGSDPHHCTGMGNQKLGSTDTCVILCPCEGGDKMKTSLVDCGACDSGGKKFGL